MLIVASNHKVAVLSHLTIQTKKNKVIDPIRLLIENCGASHSKLSNLFLEYLTSCEVQEELYYSLPKLRIVMSWIFLYLNILLVKFGS